MGRHTLSRKSTPPRNSPYWLLAWVGAELSLTTFIAQAFKIPSSSMEDTLLVGDHLLVNKFLFGHPLEAGGELLPYREVRRGDIIVFKYPFPPYQHFVKRVIGLPGDRLKIVNREVYINGEPLEEPYKIHRTPPLLGRFQDDFPVQGDYFSYASEPGWAEQVARRRQSGHNNPTPAAWDSLTHFFSRTRWNRLLHFVR